jgi:hypothetical protein
MEKNKSLLTEQIIAFISKKTKPRDYLVKKLGISKESAYRRIRNEIPFSFDEVADMSLDLGFSLDEIAGQKREFSLNGGEGNNRTQAQKSFLNMLQEYYWCMEVVDLPKEQEIWMLTNRLNLFFLLPYNTLFKLHYYQWIHRIGNLPVSLFFSKVSLPDEIEAIRDKIRAKMENFKQANLILDMELFSAFIHETEYYYRQKLISEEELRLIRRELTILLNRLKRLISQIGDRWKYRFYLSLLGVECDSIYAACNNQTHSLSWSHPVKTLMVNPMDGDWQKKYLGSMKRHSALISGSNEILQAEFIAKQEAKIDSLR